MQDDDCHKITAAARTWHIIASDANPGAGPALQII